MAVNSGPIIIAESETQIETQWSLEWMYKAAGDGDFTCCRKNHVVVEKGNHVEIPCDKARVISVIGRMFEAKLQGFLRKNDLDRYRLFLSMREKILSKLRTSTQQLTIESHLEKYVFNTAHDGELSGWSPLRLAVYEDSYHIVKKLIEETVNIECKLQRRQSDTFHLAGESILSGACRLASKPDILRLLIQSRADVDSRGEANHKSADQIGVSNHVGGLRIFLEHGFDVNEELDVFGNRLLHASIVSRSPEIAKLCIKRVLLWRIS
jgi:hypothetical protein